jgi:hypothetical protein
MTLHCAGRLGILSWIYEQRHVIAFELGLEKERPIAECGSGYLDDGLVIIQQDDDSHARTSIVFNAKEIKLFFDFNKIEVQRDFLIIDISFAEPFYSYPPGSDPGIFHPPLEA